MNRRIPAVCLPLLACGLLAAAQVQSSCTQQNVPCIDKVDPPNWWIGLPSPMLLLHGRNLSGASFFASGKVTIVQSRISANGHYAFLWLAANGAAAGKIRIRVATRSGAISVPFSFEVRASAPHSGFSPADVMYLIMTDRFADGDLANDPEISERSLPRGWHGGDLRGIEQHLDYLQQLGITTVWTTPVYDNHGARQAYHGYSATDMYAVDPHFGTLADLRSLADALHRRGMKLVLDTVPNHVGAAHPWASDPPTADWFHGTRADHRPASNDFEAITDPHASWQERRDVTQGWFANVLPDLNQENPLVRQYLIQNVIWWVESSGADGLRYDTFPYVGRPFWQALNSQLHALYPRLTTVGEIFHPNPVITSYFSGGVVRDGIDTGLTTPFDFPMYFALRAALSPPSGAGGPMRATGMHALEDVLRDDWLYPHPERLVTFLGNHDTVRFLSQPGVSIADLKIAFALLATLRGMPQIYSGDEIAMRGGEDPDNRRDFPGGFPGDAQNAFTAAGRTPEQAEVHDWVASLLQYRKAHPVLATGEQQDIVGDESALVFVRTPDLRQGCHTGTDEPYVVAVNDSEQKRNLQLSTDGTALQGCTRFDTVLGNGSAAITAGAGLTISIPGRQVVLLRAE